jgi:hypothetical protein
MVGTKAGSRGLSLHCLKPRLTIAGVAIGVIEDVVRVDAPGLRLDVPACPGVATHIVTAAGAADEAVLCFGCVIVSALR